MTNEEMAVLIQAGNKSLQERLYLNNQKLLYKYAHRYFTIHKDRCRNAGVELDDLLQESYFSLCDAVEAYRPESGYKLLSFIKYPLQNRFNTIVGYRLQKDLQEPINNAKSFDTPITGNEELLLGDTIEDTAVTAEFDNLLDRIYNKELHDALDNAMSILTERQRSILECRYYCGYTQTFLSSVLGISRERVRQTENQALRKLRNSSGRKYLAEFVPDILSNNNYSISISRGADFQIAKRL